MCIFLSVRILRYNYFRIKLNCVLPSSISEDNVRLRFWKIYMLQNFGVFVHTLYDMRWFYIVSTIYI